MRDRPLQRSLDGVVAADFRPDVEGLRAVAVVLVVLFHARAGWFAGGFIGVDVFFVVSGFLITRLLLRELHDTGSISLPRFWARRARRLLPASALTVAATVVAAQWMLPALSRRALAGDVVAVALFVANFRFANQLGDYFGAQLGQLAPSPLLHFWSLAVEEQFYLVWPALMLLVARRPRHYRRLLTVSVAVVGVASLAMSVWMTATSPTWAFYLLPTRMWELLVGAGLALAGPLFHQARPALRAAGGWIGLAMIVVAAVDFDESIPFPGAAAAVPVAATALVIVAGGEAMLPWSPARLLELRPMQWVGLHSYAIYLWHWPVLVLAEARWGPLDAWARVSAVAFAVALSAVSRRLVEDPVRHSPWLAADARRGLTLGGALCATTLLAGVATAALVPSFDTGIDAAAPSLLPSTTAVAAEGVAPTGLAGLVAATQVVLADGLATSVVPANLRPSLEGAFDDKAALYADGCVNIGVDDDVHDCRYGASGAATTIVLFGDSHAAHWFPALEQIAADRGMSLVVFTKGGCPTAAVSIPTNTLARTCPAWRDAVIDRMADLRPAMVVMTASHHYPNTDSEWQEGLAATVARVAPLTTDLVLLGDNPGASAVPATCLSEHLHDPAACVNRRARAVEPGRVAAETAVAASAGARFVDTTDWLCTAEACPVIVGDVLLYRDVNHLSTTGAAFLAPLLGAALFP